MPSTKDKATNMADAEIEVELPDHPDTVYDPVARQPGAERVATKEDEGTTRPSDLGFTPKHREIEVESVAPPPLDNTGFVEVRMARTIEEFTYGNPHRAFTLEEGKRYRFPVDVARYLNGIGAIYFR